MKGGTDPNTAARWMVEALCITAIQDQEVAVADYLSSHPASATHHARDSQA